MIEDQQICAEMVRKQDPERFLAAMTAPPEMRGRLMVVYAFNLELARIPWVTKEPMIAEMRLQYWRDMVEGVFAGGGDPSHEVAKPLARLIAQHDLPQGVLERMIGARLWDIYNDPHENPAAFERYISDTAGGVMQLAAAVLMEGPPPDEARDLGFGHGVSLLLRAVPALDQLGRSPLVARDGDSIVLLAQNALAVFDAADAALHNCDKRIIPALRSGWLTRSILRKAIATPERVLQGGLEPSQAGLRLALMGKTLRGRF